MQIKVIATLNDLSGNQTKTRDSGRISNEK